MRESFVEILAAAQGITPSLYAKLSKASVIIQTDVGEYCWCADEFVQIELPQTLTPSQPYVSGESVIVGRIQERLSQLFKFFER